MKRARAHGRRHFLRGAGGLTLAIPFLPSLVRRAGAQVDPPPKRFLAIYLPNNDTEDFPTDDGSGGVQLTGSYYEPLAGYENRMTVVRGLRDGAGHNLGHQGVLSGGAYTVENEYNALFESVDQLVRRRESEATGLPSLSLHAFLGGHSEASSTFSTISATSALNPVFPVAEPIQIYQQIVGLYDDGTSEPPPAEVDPRLLMRGNLLDAVLEDYRAVSGRVSPSDRRLLDAHLTMMEEQQREAQALLAGGGPRMVSCAPPERPRGPNSYGYGGLPDGLFNTGEWHIDPTVIDAKSDAFFGLIASGLVCGAASSATFMFGSSGGAVLPDYLERVVDESPYPTNHEVAHESRAGDARAIHFDIRRWQAERVRRVLDLMDVEDAEGRNVLDSSLVLVVSELGISNDTTGAGSHSRNDTGVVIVGGGHEGYLRSGAFVDLGTRDTYGDFLLTLAHAMGYDDLTSYGRAEAIEGWNGALETNLGHGTNVIAALRR